VRKGKWELKKISTLTTATIYILCKSFGTNVYVLGVEILNFRLTRIKLSVSVLPKDNYRQPLGAFIAFIAFTFKGSTGKPMAG
jgi:hypothetical protein